MSRADLPSFEQFAAQAREHGFDAVLERRWQTSAEGATYWVARRNARD